MGWDQIILGFQFTVSLNSFRKATKINVKTVKPQWCVIKMNEYCITVWKF